MATAAAEHEDDPESENVPGGLRRHGDIEDKRVRRLMILGRCERHKLMRNKIV